MSVQGPVALETLEVKVTGVATPVCTRLGETVRRMPVSLQAPPVTVTGVQACGPTD